jgi:hypothetical protein
MFKSGKQRSWLFANHKGNTFHNAAQSNLPHSYSTPKLPQVSQPISQSGIGAVQVKPFEKLSSFLNKFKV